MWRTLDRQEVAQRTSAISTGDGFMTDPIRKQLYCSRSITRNTSNAWTLLFGCYSWFPEFRIRCRCRGRKLRCRSSELTNSLRIAVRRNRSKPETKRELLCGHGVCLWHIISSVIMDYVASSTNMFALSKSRLWVSNTTYFNIWMYFVFNLLAPVARLCFHSFYQFEIKRRRLIV